MRCPITGVNCDKGQCGWWSENSNQCAILVVAESMKKAARK